MPTDSGYNGWKNYPTWVTNLWLTNDQGLYEISTETVRSAAEDSETPRVDGADALKELVEELFIDPLLEADETPLPGLVQDLIRYSLDNVDWIEIAGSLLEN